MRPAYATVQGRWHITVVPTPTGHWLAVGHAGGAAIEAFKDTPYEALIAVRVRAIGFDYQRHLADMVLARVARVNATAIGAVEPVPTFPAVRG